MLRSHWSALVNRHHRIAHQRKERVEEIFFDKTTTSSSSSPKRHRIDQQHNDGRDYEMIDQSEENEHVDKDLHEIDTGNGQYDQQIEDNPGARTPTPVLLRRQHGSSTSTSTGGFPLPPLLVPSCSPHTGDLMMTSLYLITGLTYSVNCLLSFVTVCSYCFHYMN